MTGKVTIHARFKSMYSKKWDIMLILRRKKIMLSSLERRTIFFINQQDMRFIIHQTEKGSDSYAFTRAEVSKDYGVEQIRGYEIIVNDDVVERISGNLGKMIAGGLLFGGLGAVAGAIDKGGRTKTSDKRTYAVRLLLDDLEHASIDVRCDSQESAYRLLHTLALLEEKYHASLRESRYDTSDAKHMDV